jgi:2-oxoglutarate ferredoxin oxidoreductase subunit alpha
MPTRTEQSDLRFAVNIGHGESPRIVLAPGSVEECFEVACRAFNLAEQYQCPVIILTDAHLATTIVSLPVDALDADAVAIERGPTLRAGRTPPAAAEPFERFATTADGVSPRAFPGDPLAVHSVTGDEHDASGHINHDEDVRVAMVEERARKMAAAARALRPPQLHGSADAATTLISWGSTSMACREAVDSAAQQGLSVNSLQFGDLWPFPLEAEAMLRRCRRLVLVEQNASGQLGELIRQATGISIEERLLDSSGRPLTPEAVLDRVRDEVVVDLATWRRAA